MMKTVYIFISDNQYRKYERQAYINAAKELNLDFKLIDVNDLSLNLQTNQLFYKQTKLVKPDIVLFWYGIRTDEWLWWLFEYYQDLEVLCYNQFEKIMLVKEKFRLHQRLAKTKIKQLDCYKITLTTSKEQLQNLKYPLVFKSSAGSFGKGIHYLSDYQALKNLQEAYQLQNSEYSFFLQSYLDYDYDVRVFVIGQDYYAMQRKSDDDFRANFSTGAQISSYEITPKMKQVIKEIQTQVAMEIMGIDLLIKDEEIYLCEINSAPGFKGLESIVQIDIARKILEFISK